MNRAEALAGSYAIPWTIDEGTGAVVSTTTVNVTTNVGGICPANSNCVNTTSGYGSVW
jgi:hypothetical protein